MANDVLKQALREATVGLEGISREFAALQAKKERFEAVVNSLSALLGEETENLPLALVAHSNESDATPPQRFTWMVVHDVLRDAAKPLPLTEVHRRAITIGPNTLSRDAVRIAMSRRPQTFIQKNGFYSLAEKGREDGGNSFKSQEATRVAS